jgi:hypothetical protein
MRLVGIVTVSFVISAVLAVRWQLNEHRDFETAVQRAVLVEEINRNSARCPLSAEAINVAKPWLLAACAESGLGWYEAEATYGSDAEKVYLLYGQDPGLAEVFDRYGPVVVPVITYFVRHGSMQYLLQDAIGQGWSNLWGEKDARSVPELSPEQYGLIAIEELRDRGYEMLSEFEIVDGVAVRKQFTRAVLAAKNVAFGGVSDIERVIARGERLPTWDEVGWASVDAVIVVGGLGVAAKSFRLARSPIAAAVGSSTARLQLLRGAGRTATRSLSAVAKAAGVATVVAVPYLAITHPTLLTNAAGWMAEQAGVPGWVGPFVVYFVISGVMVVLLRMLVRPFVWSVRTCKKMGSFVTN